MKITGHGFNPGIRDSDQRLTQVLAGKANRLEHGARSSPVAPIGYEMAAVFQVHSTKDYDSRAESESSAAACNLGRDGANLCK
jgi:hypothetical protein